MIYTFYSYKGGVGRSMALANVAECFYAQGLRVLIVDWDLEAPGLETFFFDDQSLGATEAGRRRALVEASLGLIDLLLEYRRLCPHLQRPEPAAGVAVPASFADFAAQAQAEGPQGLAPFMAQLDAQLPPLSTYVVDVHAPGTVDPASLRLLPAGWRHQDRFAAYAHSVRSFDWEEFYRSYRGQEFFDWLRNKLLQQADVVLIDSRTGVTEMGGVCARQLADVVVSFSAPNRQNIEGVVRMAHSFRRRETLEARDGRALSTVVVPTRIDPTELDDLKHFELRFRELAEKTQPRDEAPPEAATHAPDSLLPPMFRTLGLDFWRLQIPYRAKYAYHERRVIGPGVVNLDPTTNGLLEAYWKLADHLALLAPESHPIRRCFADRLVAAFPALARVLLSCMPDAVATAGTLQAQLQAEGIELAPALCHDGVGEGGGASRGLARVDQARQLVALASEQALDPAGPIRRELRFARQRGRPAYLLRNGWHGSLPAWTDAVDVVESVTPAFLARLRSKSPVQRAPVLVPVLREGYIERLDSERALVQALLAAARQPRRSVLGLCSSGGMGKSTLWARVGQDEDVIDAYPAGLLTVSAGDSGAARQMADALRAEGREEPGGTVLEQVRALLQGRRCLLVIDDAWQREAVDELASLVDEGTVLVLTRDASLAHAVTHQVLTLGAMEPSQARHFLPQAPDLADRLEGWPLALAAARSMLLREQALGHPLETVLGDLRQRLERHGLVAFDRADGDRTDSVSRSIEYTLQQLQRWQRRRFEQLALLCEAGPVSLEAVYAHWKCMSADVGEPRPWRRPDMEGFHARLKDLSLVSAQVQRGSTGLGQPLRDYLRAQGLIGQTRAELPKPRLSSGLDRQHNPDVALVQRVLDGEVVPFDELLALAKRLKNARYFDYARRIFARLRNMPEAAARHPYLVQQQALCTYKDTDLHAASRFDMALELLMQHADLARTTDQETLGLAGAIFKYKWSVFGQHQYLERSLAYYRHGYRQGPEKDCGYTAINAAFVLDLMAAREQAEAGGDEAASARQRREEARRIREHVLAVLGTPSYTAPLRNDWWFLVTMAEACFGLQRHDQARAWLREALHAEVQEWEFHSTAQQLAQLALLHNDGCMPEEDSQAYRTLRMFLGDDLVALRSTATGKVGLALSGGGFRASLFHIGVLARLAEIDMLRHVEVLSCVSGGSIIGAHYYLAVKRLLERKADAEIKREDYVQLVQDIEADFLAGVQTNPRTRLLANPWPNLKSLFIPHYSRTERLGELFERDIFARVDRREAAYAQAAAQAEAGACAPDPAEPAPGAPAPAQALGKPAPGAAAAAAAGEAPPGLYLGQENLLIRPKGVRGDFVPKLENWRRAAKVPVLILNATTLNTGHNWQFTASWMGEPPAGVSAEVDGNDMLRRLYYWQAPQAHRRISLGRAVAASACVPGLFDPVQLDGLYPERSVRLVDGGVHDNQGVGGLLEQECSVLLVSDASGQMASQSAPAAGPFKVPLRASSIQGARVRQAQFLDLDSRRRASLIRGLMFIHLRMGLDTEPIAWNGCKGSPDADEEPRRRPLTEYGVLKTVQRRLAGVRTDLDSFNDTEAFALMLSGYRMARHELARSLPDLASAPAGEVSWRFRAIDNSMDRAHDFEHGHEALMKLLAAGETRFFKLWKLSAGLRAEYMGLLVALVALLVLLWPGQHQAQALLSSLSVVLSLAAMVLLGVPLLLWLVYRAAGVPKPLWQLLSGFLFAAGGWIGPRLHLLFFDPGYLAAGALAQRRPPAAGTTVGAWLRPLSLLAIVGLFLTGSYFWALRQALVAQESGDYATALRRWNVVLTVRQTPRALLARAQTEVALGAYDRALADFELAKVAGADARAVYRGRALVYQLTGNHAAAVAALDQLLATGDDPSVRAERARALAAIDTPVKQAAADKSPLQAFNYEIFACNDNRVAVEGARQWLLQRDVSEDQVKVQPIDAESLTQYFQPTSARYQVRYRADEPGQLAAVKTLLDDKAFQQIGPWEGVKVSRAGRDAVRLVVCDANAGSRAGDGGVAVPASPSALR